MPALKTTSQFIEDARKVHGDRYDYSKVVYVNSKTKVCIICPEHGEFWQAPNPHLTHKCGCPKCGMEVTRGRLSFTQDQILEQARAIHGDKYDYSKVRYVDYRTKFCVICPTHGEFWISANGLISQQRGCASCSNEEKSRRMTRNRSWFVERALSIHGNQYDYSKVNYIGIFDKVCIICKKHGDFWQRPNTHLNGAGCPECAKISIYEKERKSFDQFLCDARKVHGDKYSYDKVNYISNHDKICITCPTHGDFWQTPTNHIHNAAGCPRCAGGYSPTTEEYIEQAIAVHGYKYDYSLVEYRKGTDKIKIICPDHGVFEQSAKIHLRGCGCPKCNPSYRYTTETFIQRGREIFGNKFDYSLVRYVNNRTPVKIICPEHGIFETVAANHLSGRDCPKCSRQYMDTDFFVEVASKKHSGKYSYKNVRYVGYNIPVIITCPIHGDFEKLPCRHLTGDGCPQCSESHLERDVRLLLRRHKIDFNTEQTFSWLTYNGKMFLDFYLPEYHIAIECQGEQHFRPVGFFGGEEAYENLKERDKQKKELCEQHNIKLIYFSDLGIKYPYEVIEGAENLLNIILHGDNNGNKQLTIFD